jgi:hypothetical protein
MIFLWGQALELSSFSALTDTLFASPVNPVLLYRELVRVLGGRSVSRQTSSDALPTHNAPPGSIAPAVPPTPGDYRLNNSTPSPPPRYPSLSFPPAYEASPLGDHVSSVQMSSNNPEAHIAS